MTLLELILAMALSILVLGGVAMAISLFLRTLDARRSQVEETQIARAVLRMIADDLRGAVQQEKLDFSKAGSAAAVASSAIADAASGAAAATGTGGATGTAGGGSSTSGGASSGGGASTATKGGTGGATNDGTTSGGGAGGSTSSGSTGSSGTAGTPSSSGTAGATGGTAESSTASQNIDEATEPPPVPGIFGNQYELQVDISRLPRIDELSLSQASSDGSTVTDMPSDIKTIAYYVRATEAQPGTGFSAASTGSALGREMRRPGLVRRQLDRAVTMYASQSGRSTDLQSKEQLVAPEVISVEFRYFDGTQWLTSWDSIEQNRLPSAVEIIVALQPGGEQFQGTSGTAASSTTPNAQPLLFRQLVRIPASRTCPETSTTSSADTSGAATGADTGAAAGSGTSSGAGAASGS